MNVDGIEYTEEEIQAIIRKCKCVMPYVMATISPGCHFKSKERPDWIEIHAGRANSSYEQLQAIATLVEKQNVIY